MVALPDHRLFAAALGPRAAFSRRWRRHARLAGIALAGAGVLGLMLVNEPRTSFGRLLMAFGLPGAASGVIADPAWRAPALYAAGRYPEAIAIFRAQGRRGSYNLANALARSGDLRAALDAYDEALLYNPRDADAQANRSLVARLVEEQDEQTKGGGIANATAQYGSRFKKNDNLDKNNDAVKATSSGEGLAGRGEASSTESLPGNSAVSRRGRAEQQALDSGQGQARGSVGDASGRGRNGGGSAFVAAAPEKEARRVTKSFEAHEIHPDRLWLQTLPDEPGRYLKLRLKAEQTRRQEEAGIAMPGGSNPW